MNYIHTSTSSILTSNLPSRWKQKVPLPFYIHKQLEKRMLRSLFLSTEKPPYLGGQITNTCDFQCDCCRVLQCNFRRKCKLAAIAPRFRCDICRNFPQIAVKLIETSAISRRQIAQKSPLVYTCNFYRELERKTKIALKSAIKTKNRSVNGL